jgi:hypothetical protein
MYVREGKGVCVWGGGGREGGRGGDGTFGYQHGYHTGGCRQSSASYASRAGEPRFYATPPGGHQHVCRTGMCALRSIGCPRLLQSYARPHWPL